MTPFFAVLLLGTVPLLGHWCHIFFLRLLYFISYDFLDLDGIGSYGCISTCALFKTLGTFPCNEGADVSIRVVTDKEIMIQYPIFRQYPFYINDTLSFFK